MANKTTLRKASDTKKLSVRDILSPNVRIAALLVVAGALLATVTVISIAGKDKSRNTQLASENGKALAAEGENSVNGGSLTAPNTAADNNGSANNKNAGADEMLTEIGSDTTVAGTFEDSSVTKAAMPAGSDNTTETDLSVSDAVDGESAKVTKTKSAPISVPFDGVLKYGDDDKAVEKIQERLMELCYMDSDEVTDHFGPITRDAVSSFQRRSGFEPTGKVNAKTYRALMADDALVYMMSVGDDGDDVASIQDRLYEMGYLSIKPTGYFGDSTEAAVKSFQNNNGLSADGKVGTETKNLIFSEDAAPNIWEKGDNSETLVPYQKKLISLGYLTGDADGNYGTATKAAVKRFQDRNGLPSDGYLGPKTIDALMGSDAVANAYTIGDDCSAVEKIQKELYNLGYVKKSAITGYFGSATEYAVKAFQKRNDLTADGRVGQKTLNAIMDDDAKKASSSYQFYGEGSSSGNSGSGNGNGNGSGGSSSSDNSSSSPSIARLVDAAKSRLGCRYVTGGKGSDRFDCSGLVYWCLNQAGIRQSYLTSYGWRSVSKYQRISKIDNLRAGDIIVFYGHVGIIVSGSDMIDASSSNGKVVRRSFTGSWSRRNFICGYRIFD